MTARAMWAVLTALLLLTGCKGRDAVRLEGTATYREHMSLPAGAVLEVDLVELGPASGEADRRVIASSVNENPGPVPIAFEIRYKKSVLDPSRAHGLDARIRLGERVLFETRTPVPVLTGKDVKSIEVLLTRSGPEGDMAALEAEVAAIDAKAASLRRVEGSYKEGNIAGSFVAYLDGDAPILIFEGRDLVALGSSSVGLHFRDGALLRYAEDTIRKSATNSGLDKGVSVSLKLYFDHSRYVGGTKTVDNVAEEPEEREITAAAAAATLALSRVSGKLARAPGTRNALILACSDGATFGTVPDPSGDSLRLERLGRDPLVLPRVQSATGTLYGDATRSLHLKGDNATWMSGDNPAVACKRAAAGTALRLAPGQFPAAALSERPSTAWEHKLLNMLPAIDACLAHGKLDLPRVTQATAMAGGVISVSLMSADGGRVSCTVSQDGSALRSYDTSASRAGEPTDLKTAIFTPAASAYPAAPCYVHERVISPDGTFLGWLSQSRC